jgi:hypothetical protein
MCTRTFVQIVTKSKLIHGSQIYLKWSWLINLPKTSSNVGKTGFPYGTDSTLPMVLFWASFTLSLLTSYIYGPTFGNAESRLFLFAVQCFNTESMQKVILCQVVCKHFSRYSYSLPAGRSGNRIPVLAKFSAHIHIGPAAHPASYTIGATGVKRPRRGVDHPPHLAPRLKKEQRHTSTPPLGLRGLFQVDLYLYLYRVRHVKL